MVDMITEVKHNNIERGEKICCILLYIMAAEGILLIVICNFFGFEIHLRKWPSSYVTRNFFVHKLARSFIANELLIMHLAGLWLL